MLCDATSEGREDAAEEDRSKVMDVCREAAEWGRGRFGRPWVSAVRKRETQDQAWSIKVRTIGKDTDTQGGYSSEPVPSR